MAGARSQTRARPHTTRTPSRRCMDSCEPARIGQPEGHALFRLICNTWGHAFAMRKPLKLTSQVPTMICSFSCTLIAATRGTHPSHHPVASAAIPPGLKIEGLRLCAFTRIDSFVVSRVTAHRDDPRSNERSVTELPDNSGRETKPESKAACPTENPSPPAVLAEAMGAKATGV